MKECVLYRLDILLLISQCRQSLNNVLSPCLRAIRPHPSMILGTILNTINRSLSPPPHWSILTTIHPTTAVSPTAPLPHSAPPPHLSHLRSPTPRHTHIFPTVMTKRPQHIYPKVAEPQSHPETLKQVQKSRVMMGSACGEERVLAPVS